MKFPFFHLPAEDDITKWSAWKDPKFFAYAAVAYGLVGAGLVVAWHLTSYVPVLLFGITALLGAAINASHATMGRESLRVYFERKKKQNAIFIGAFVTFVCVGYVSVALLPRSFFDAVDMFEIVSMACLPVAIASTIDHVVSRLRYRT